jgi:hypothetical protein
MEDADASDASTESLDSQYNKVMTETTLSHVMRYGDLDFKNEVVGDFYGDLDVSSSPVVKSSATFFDKLFRNARSLSSTPKKTLQDPKKHISATSSRDIKLHHLYSTVATKKTHKAQLDLSAELTQRMRVDHVFEAFQPTELRSSTTVLPRNFDCLKTLMNTYESACERMDDYSL